MTVMSNQYITQDYATLNNASEIYDLPELAPGDTEVWYAKAPAFGFENDSYNRSNLTNTHTKLGEVAGKSLEKLYRALQGESWSPFGEANGLIRRHGLSHTSFSVGDVLIIDDVAYVCQTLGFGRLNS